MQEPGVVDRELLAYLEGYLTEARKQRFEQVLDARSRHLVVAVEDVYQMHNTSAVLRSCDVFGVQELHVVEARFGRRMDKNIAMGAQQWVDVYRYERTRSCLKELKARGYEIVATTPSADAVALSDFEIKGPLAVFFGTEKEGLGPEILESADRKLHIPMRGFSESLNISVAAAIVLYTLSDRLRRCDPSWSLDSEDRAGLRLAWARHTLKDADGLIRRFLANREKG